jgi:acetyl esterase/lipase
VFEYEITEPQNMKKKVYTTYNDINLHLYIFEPENREPKKLVSGIVFFHGGRQKASQFFPQCEYFCKRGMMAISAEYRSWAISPAESVTDGKAVIRWIRNHALKLGIDIERIAAAGASMGGHTALCTALFNGYEPDTTDSSVNSKPTALVLFNPVVNTVSNPNIAQFFKGNPEDLSPMHHLKKGLPPMIIFHGTRDIIIPIKEIENFTIKAKNLGNHCELVSFERKGHAFFNFGMYKNRPFNETLRATDKFLSTLRYLKGEPTIQ